MARDKDRDDKDWEAIRDRRQSERDAARERAYEAAAAEEAKQLAKDDKDAAASIEMLLGLAQSMDDAALDAAIKKHGKKHGRLSDKEKTRIKRAKGKKKKSSGSCAVIAFLLISGIGGVLFGAYEGVTALASALF